jgi:hypothetical protein
VEWRTALVNPVIDEVQIEAEQPPEPDHARYLSRISHATDRLGREIQFEGGGIHVAKPRSHCLSHDSPPFHIILPTALFHDRSRDMVQQVAKVFQPLEVVLARLPLAGHAGANKPILRAAAVIHALYCVKLMSIPRL